MKIGFEGMLEHAGFESFMAVGFEENTVSRPFALVISWRIV
jgi:hypothetical protein